MCLLTLSLFLPGRHRASPGFIEASAYAVQSVAQEVGAQAVFANIQYEVRSSLMMSLVFLTIHFLCSSS